MLDFLRWSRSLFFDTSTTLYSDQNTNLSCETTLWHVVPFEATFSGMQNSPANATSPENHPMELQVFLLKKNSNFFAKLQKIIILTNNVFQII